MIPKASAQTGNELSGRLSDRPWIVIVVVVDDARAMTLGTGDDVAVLILDPALATALRTDFHAACPVPSGQHRIYETPVPHRRASRGHTPAGDLELMSVGGTKRTC